MAATMIKAHKIRLNPTPEQEEYLRRAAGTRRFVYNWGIDRDLNAAINLQREAHRVLGEVLHIPVLDIGSGRT